jgi:hypothetical protein
MTVNMGQDVRFLGGNLNSRPNAYDAAILFVTIDSHFLLEPGHFWFVLC